ncbi:hypothetical protein PLICRDRAFT_86700 [Plicaturopsis crispa FD-325 SS-3]|nr:hypothetical protein PLICRDRAFT_86700 [Plicaturopsis crispa FD-325 SS-3]
MSSSKADEMHALVHQPHSFSAGRPRPSILFLPTELLAMIFEHVHFEYLDTWMFISIMAMRHSPDEDSDSEDEEPEPPKPRELIYWTDEEFNDYFPEGPEWSKENVDVGAWDLFPYNLAAICPRWRSILSAVPKYWTRLVIDIGRDATPLPDVRSYLAWSEDLPLEVTVLRRDGYEGTDALEATRVAAVTQLLAPHFHRFKTLEIRVLDSMSLPTLGTDLHGTAGRLTKINFTSVRDSGGSNRPPMSAKVAFETPVLTELSLDGENFRILLNSRVWPTLHLRRLTILEHTSRAGIGEGLSLPALAKGLEIHDVPEYLEIRNVFFDPAGDDYVPDEPHELLLSTCHLTGLSEAQMAEFLRLFSWHTESLHLTSITLPNFDSDDRENFFTYYLSLDNVEGDVLGFLRAGHCNDLHVSNSRSFDDNTLEQMRAKEILWQLLDLGIYECPNVSGRAVRRLVEERQKAAAALAEKYPDDDELDRGTCPISSLAYDGIVSEEDWRWFKQDYTGGSLHIKHHT